MKAALSLESRAYANIIIESSQCKVLSALEQLYLFIMTSSTIKN